MNVEVISFDVGWTLFDEDARLWKWAEWLCNKLQHRHPFEVVEYYKRLCTVPKEERKSNSRSYDTILHFTNSPGFAAEWHKESPWHKFDFEPYPGAIDCVATLRKKGFRLIVISNQGVETREYLRKWGIHDCFEWIGISKELGVEKPDLRFYKKAIFETLVPPDQILHIGDRPDHDTEPARAVGMRTCRIHTGPYKDMPNISEPDLSFASMEEFNEFIRCGKILRTSRVDAK